jgi:hypothetical protein
VQLDTFPEEKVKFFLIKPISLMKIRTLPRPRVLVQSLRGFAWDADPETPSVEHIVEYTAFQQI